MNGLLCATYIDFSRSRPWHWHCTALCARIFFHVVLTALVLALGAGIGAIVLGTLQPPQAVIILVMPTAAPARTPTPTPVLLVPPVTLGGYGYSSERCGDENGEVRPWVDASDG